MAKKKIVPKPWERFYGFDDYFRMAEESEGFDVCSDGQLLCGGIVEMVEADESALQKAIRAAKFAIDKHNEENNTDLEFVSIVKLNGQLVSGLLYYLTIEVRSPSLDQTSIYQAKVWRMLDNNHIVRIFRKRPHDYVTPGPEAWSKKRKTVPRGAFLSFRSDLRKLPQLANMKPLDVTTLTSKIWKTMSVQEKVDYYKARDLEFEDIADFVEDVDLNEVLDSRLRKFSYIAREVL